MSEQLDYAAIAADCRGTAEQIAYYVKEYLSYSDENRGINHELELHWLEQAARWTKTSAEWLEREIYWAKRRQETEGEEK